MTPLFHQMEDSTAGRINLHSSFFVLQYSLFISLQGQIPSVFAKQNSGRPVWPLRGDLGRSKTCRLPRIRSPQYLRENDLRSHFPKRLDLDFTFSTAKASLPFGKDAFIISDSLAAALPELPEAVFLPPPVPCAFWPAWNRGPDTSSASPRSWADRR